MTGRKAQSRRRSVYSLVFLQISIATTAKSRHFGMDYKSYMCNNCVRAFTHTNPHILATSNWHYAPTVSNLRSLSCLRHALGVVLPSWCDLHSIVACRALALFSHTHSHSYRLVVRMHLSPILLRCLHYLL